MVIVGIDENGLGFRNQRMIGPLVITASAFRRKREYRLNSNSFWNELREIVSKNRSDTDRLVVCDSKQLFKSNDQKAYRLGESTALAFYSVLNRKLAGDFDKDFLPSIDLDNKYLPDGCSINWESSLCGSGTPYNLPAWKVEVNLIADISRRLRNVLSKQSIEFVSWKSKVFCPWALNKAQRKNLDKYWLEIQTIADFISLFLKNYPDEKICFFSGKVDGWGRSKISSCLGERFEIISSFSREGKDIFKISFMGKKAEVSFVKAADKFIFPVSLSSIFGKYIREIFVRRINESLKKLDNSIEWCGGYRQGKKFDRFLGKAMKIAVREGIPKECLLR